jgi:6-phosphogluconolactonase (cycloisomerase 2 family)
MVMPVRRSNRPGRVRTSTRREFVRAVSACVTFEPVIAAAWQPQRGTIARRIFAYVGTYSSAQGPNRGQGIHILEMNPSNGALLPLDILKSESNPAWLAFNRDRTHLYSANEVAVAETGSGSASAYAIDRQTGRLTLVNTVSSEGAGPAHLSIHPAGKHALVANYAGGSVAVLPIEPDGRLAPASDVKRHQGTVGPARASTAPPGSYAISGHDRPHAHMIEADLSGRFVLAADLALDQILIWRFDPARGTLTPNDPPSVALPGGDGPRHFAFHPKGQWLYSLQEEASTVVTFDYDGSNGRLRAKQTLSTLPRGFAGTNFTSGIVVSSDARFVYVANRLHDSIAWFSIGGDGTLTRAGEEWTRGDYPRSFTIDPSGRFLYSCNQRSDAITTFRVDPKSGGLTFTGRYTPVGSPAHIIFLA